MASDSLPELRPIVTRAEALASGAKRYFTGSTCLHGHITERHTSSRVCVRCSRIRWLAWIKQNPSWIAEHKRSDHAKHLESRRATQRKWEDNNPEVRASLNRKWASLNPDKHKVYVAVKNARRRAAIRNASGSVTGDDVVAILVRQKYRCAWCNGSIKKRWHMDHVVPLAKGGEHSASNLVGSCPSCNTRKSAKDPIVWAQSLGRLI